MLLGDEMVERAVVGRLNLRIALQWLSLCEISNRIVAFKSDAIPVGEHERLAARAVAHDEAGPVLVCFHNVAFLISVELICRLLVVLEDKSSINDLKPLRADGRQAINARRVTAVTAVSRRILYRICV